MTEPVRVGSLRGIMMRGPGVSATLPFYEDMWGLSLSHQEDGVARQSSSAVSAKVETRPCVVDEQVAALEAVADLVGKGPDLVGGEDRERAGIDPLVAVVAGEDAAHVVQPALVAGEEGDLGALLEQEADGGEADAGRAAGDDRDLSLVAVVHHFVLSSGKPGSGRPCITARCAGVGGPAVIQRSMASGSVRGQTLASWLVDLLQRASPRCCAASPRRSSACGTPTAPSAP
jgi:hypothetical protein